jgi:hypothetical protein
MVNGQPSMVDRLEAIKAEKIKDERRPGWGVSG